MSSASISTSLNCCKTQDSIASAMPQGITNLRRGALEMRFAAEFLVYVKFIIKFCENFT
jgi:hypothetical protein